MSILCFHKHSGITHLNNILIKEIFELHYRNQIMINLLYRNFASKYFFL